MSVFLGPIDHHPAYDSVIEKHKEFADIYFEGAPTAEAVPITGNTSPLGNTKDEAPPSKSV